MNVKKNFLKMFFVFNLLIGNSLASVVESDLGRGVLSYDIKAGIKDRCVSLRQDETIKSDVRKTNYSLELVKSKEELYDKITSSSSSEGSYYSFSAGAKVNFMKELKWNYNSVYLWVRASRITNKIKIAKDNLLLTEYARNIMLDSRFVFSEICGDKIITEIELGGEIFGVLEVKTETFQEKQILEMEVEGRGTFGGGSVKGSSDYKRIIEKLKEKHLVKITYLHIGGKTLEVPQNEEGFLKISSQIEELTDAHPVPVESLTRDYSTISNNVIDPNSPEVKERQDMINTAEIKLNEARTSFANGLYVLNHSSDFVMLGFDKDELQNQLGQMESYIWKLKRFKESAFSFSESVEPTILFQMPVIKLPKKKLWERNKPLNVKCEQKTSNLCGVKNYQVKESAYCGVKSPKTGTGPACGALFKEGKSAECGIKLYRETRSEYCGAELYRQCHSSSCGKNWDGSRKRCRHSSCGVERFKSCRNKEHGVEEYNTCRSANFGIEKYETCSDPSFGYNFNSCEHFSHGPESFIACNIATIGKKETYCPNL